MDEHDDQDCNTTLELGLNQYGPRRNISGGFSLDRLILYHSDVDIIESSSNLKSSTENDKKISKEDDDYISHSKNYGSKKLRLTRDQTTLLEDSFQQHSTLNPAQKHVLAEKLSLKPRQVEVWFQNRRARTKLKQTEIDCKFLKKNCERLCEENRKLKKELLELRSATKTQKTPTKEAAPPQWCFFHVPKAAKLETCPSCRNKTDKSRGGAGEQAAVAEAVMEVVHDPKGDNQQRMAI